MTVCKGGGVVDDERSERLPFKDGTWRYVVIATGRADGTKGSGTFAAFSNPVDAQLSDAAPTRTMRALAARTKMDSTVRASRAKNARLKQVTGSF